MKIIKISLLTLSLSISSASAVTFNLGKDIQQCLTLPAYGDEKNQTQCKDELKDASEKSLEKNSK